MIASGQNITAETVRSVLDYNPGTGVLSWKVRSVENFRATETRPVHLVCESWNTRYAGKIAGCLGPRGYWQIVINDHPYRAHRLVWMIMCGKWPDHQVDHINGDRLDNRWKNLRAAKSAENRQNMAISSRNTSGYTGVYWSRQSERWYAQIRFDGVAHHLGLFDSPVEAYEAYLTAKAKYHLFQPIPREAA